MLPLSKLSVPSPTVRWLIAWEAVCVSIYSTDCIFLLGRNNLFRVSISVYLHCRMIVIACLHIVFAYLHIKRVHCLCMSHGVLYVFVLSFLCVSIEGFSPNDRPVTWHMT